MQSGLDLREYCIKEADLHGKKGDKTLECMGINTQAGKVIEIKSYYFGANKAKPELLKEEPCRSVFERLEKGFRNTEGIKLWDIAHFDSEAANTYAMYFDTIKVKPSDIPGLIRVFTELSGENEVFEKAFLRDFEAARAYIEEDLAPVLQLGVQFDQTGSILSTKYYLVVKESRNKEAAFSDRMLKLIESTGRCEACRFLPKKAALLEGFGYLPGLMGINTERNGSKKQKLYFDAGKAFSIGGDVRSKAVELLEALELSECINKGLINEFYEHGLYVRGVGLNTADEKEIRLYLDQI